MALYFNTTASDPMQHSTPHSSSPTSSLFSPGLPCPQTEAQTNTTGTNWRDVFEALQNMHELFEALEQEWVAIPAQVIHNLIQFMPERCWAVIDSRGRHTPYWYACPSVAKYRVVNFFSDKKGVKITKFDLNQLENGIWWTWFFCCWIF